MKKITAYKGRKLSRVRKNAKVLSRESSFPRKLFLVHSWKFILQKMLSQSNDAH